MISNIKYFFKSCFFFLKALLFEKEYDVVFYYPQHFIRDENNENLYFKDLIEACKNNEISYLLFEEPDYNRTNNRSSSAVPFDFVFILIVLLRKFIKKENSILKDKYVGEKMSATLFRKIRFKKVITISQSMISFFRGVDNECLIYDLQHGIIHNDKPNYILNNKPDDNIIFNDVFLLLSGTSYQNILIKNDNSSYFKSHTYVLGSSDIKSENLHEEFNNNVLVTLQFTHDHSDKENHILLESISSYIQMNSKINFYLRNHPRFNNEVDISSLFLLENVNSSPVSIRDCFQLCSLHVTAYSTSVFEAAQFGVPSIIVNPLEKFDYYYTDFNYPINYCINDFQDKSVYCTAVKKIKKWNDTYYSPFSEKKFLSLLR